MKSQDLIELVTGGRASNLLSPAIAAALFSLFLVASVIDVAAQKETPPPPSAPKAVKIPAVQQRVLKNGLTVAVVERTSVPLVTIQLLVRSGASSEAANKAGLADITATMLTKGTKARTATEIAEAIEFLGGSINSGAGWYSSSVSVTITSDKVDQAMAILSDVALNPKFDQKELELLKSQTLDGLTYNLKQPSFLANYVASKYSFGEHPAGGTPSSIESITQSDISAFHSKYYKPSNSVLIFTGDISLVKAAAETEKFLVSWKGADTANANASGGGEALAAGSKEELKRILVVDLPKSGQAAVSYYRDINGVGRKSSEYFPASVMNGVLGGGYSARLNQEIRIKRGLSYGAGSGFAWRPGKTNFSTRTQTKNESAAEVAELVMTEIAKLSKTDVSGNELVPRKSVLTGNFDRALETTGGLATVVAEFYSFGIPTSELNNYVEHVNGVAGPQIKAFAATNLFGGDLVIVGDYSIFKDDLAKRFPNIKVDVIKADDIDMRESDLRKKEIP